MRGLLQRVSGARVEVAGEIVGSIDQGLLVLVAVEPDDTEANAAKFMGAEAGFRACETAIFTHGGMGYAKEFHVERYMRESWIPRLAPVSPQLILCFIAEKVLGLPKSY